MNDDDKNVGPQPWIDPALEARVVAGVLGETSAFEASELERILAENPELAIFKRRIEAVHALVGAAIRPEAPKIQLSPGRRRQLLEKLGARPAQPTKKVKAFTQPFRRWLSPQMLNRLVACLVIMAFVAVLFSLSIPAVTGSLQKSSRRSFGASMNKEQPEFSGEAGGFVTSGPASSSSARGSFSTRPAGGQVAVQDVQTVTEGGLMSSKAMAEKTLGLAMKAAPMENERAMSEEAPPAAASAPPVSLTTGARAINGGTGAMSAPSATMMPPDAQPLQKMAQQAAKVEVLQKEQQELRQNDTSSALELASAASGVNQDVGGVAHAPMAAQRELASSDGTGGEDARGEAVVDRLRSASDEKPADKLVAATDELRAPMAEARAEATPQSNNYAYPLKAAGDSVTVLKDQVKRMPELKAQLAERADEIRDSNGKIDGYIQYGAPIMASPDTAMAANKEDQPLLLNKSPSSRKAEPEADSTALQTDARLGGAQATAIMAFTGGWGKGSGAGSGARSGLVKNEGRKQAEQESLKDAVAVDGSAKQTGASPGTDWDNSYMFRGVNVLLAGAASTTRNTRSGSDVSGSDGAAVPMEFAKADSFDGGDKQRVLNQSKGADLTSNLEVTTRSGQQANVEVVRESGDLASDREDKKRVQNQPGKPGFISEASGERALAGANTYSGSTTVSGGKLSVAKGKEIAEAKKLTDAKSAAAPVLGDVPVSGRLFRSDSDKDRALAFQNEIKTAKQPFSTFSLHVSDVSFQLAKDALAKGTMPDPDRIRAEEFYNAFDYNDPSPGPGEEVACRIEECAHPFVQQRDLVRIALKVAAAGRAAGQPLRLTILLDTSGSMEREDRAASVRRALGTLATLLGPNDRVTLIGFARTPRLLAEQVPGDQAGKLVEIAARTPSEGGTNLEQALALASELALKQRLPAAQNRIVLLTDGAANLGNADPARLAREIEKTRQRGISFDACGVGANGLNDEMLEALTRKGDGRYYFLNRPEDADAGFARQLAGALRPAAENVKVQVVFNPARVGRYRLIGFEKHLLKKEDFRNDKVQAAELAAEEAGVALYQVQTLPEGEGELGEVFVRFRDPATGMMVERSWTMPYDAKAPAFDKAAPSMQLAVTAALLAEKLRGDSRVDLNAMAPVITNLRGRYPHQAKVGELIWMFERMRQ